MGFRSLWALSLAVLVGTGCANGLQIKKDYGVLKVEIDRLDADFGRECAPEALAIAEANRVAAEEEMLRGDGRRASTHINAGLRYVRLAEAESATCRDKKRQPVVVEVKVGDADGDGIADDKDQCPREPEDFDGKKDTDGCPDNDDQDGDGIADDIDACPTQPEDRDGDRDTDGCPDLSTDRDGDGISDGSDSCPDQPEDADGYQDTDGCPEVDNDGDGIFDVVDRCPMEAEDLDGFEDSDGCPDPDNDRDGLADTVDQCPGQAETMNGFEDNDGCPDTDTPKTVYIENQQIKIREQINFETGKAIIKPDSYYILDAVAEVMGTNAKIKVRIEGHTDDQGSEVYNLNLSKSRAAAVRDYLIKKGGIDATRMTSVGLGESTPLDTNTTPEGRAKNRRVEFHITDQ